MGSGVSGRYYTSYGSHAIHHEGIIHSFEGEFTMKDGNSGPAKKRRTWTGGYRCNGRKWYKI